MSRNNRFRLLSCLITTAFMTLPLSNLFAASPVFERQVVDNDIKIGYGIVIGNVDGDQKPDLLIADKSEIAWYKNPGKRGVAWPRHVMARNLTRKDNVCLAARDLNDDGLVEVAVGANWNPGETGNPQESGAIFYLQRPSDPTQPWTPITIAPHDPTVHRMHWIQQDEGDYALAVLPLHGRKNQGGQGVPVRLSAYRIDLESPNKSEMVSLDESMHMTHNFDVISNQSEADALLVAGSEGLKYITPNRAILFAPQPLSRGAGEVRRVNVDSDKHEVTSIEPMHGSEVVFYQQTDGADFKRVVIDSGLNQGHALAAADLLDLGSDQVVAGWRSPDAQNRVGIRLYVPNEDGSQWTKHTIDDNQMACEDLRLADLDGDGQLEIIAAGRATNNLIVYWNDSQND